MSTWHDIENFLLDHQFQLGGPTLCQSDGSRQACPMHATNSLHYVGRARDYGSSDNDSVAIARFLEPYAKGADYVIQELFCNVNGENMWWAEGAPAYGVGGHTDHTHAGIRDGAVFGNVPSSGDYQEVGDMQFPTLQVGSNGLMVKRAQALLYVLGHDPGTSDADRWDGNFGPRVQGAVESFQQAHGLGVDGVIGPVTWSRLLQSPT